MEGTKSMALPRFIETWQVDKLLLVLAAMFFLPFIFHVLPVSSDTPLGAIWLPIFYAPIVTLFCFRPHVALFAALCAPTINLIITGRPTFEMAQSLSYELAVFVLVTHWIIKWKKHFWLAGAIGYLFAKFSVGFLMQKDLGDVGSAASHALPGIIILVFINFIMTRTKMGR